MESPPTAAAEPKTPRRPNRRRAPLDRRADLLAVTVSCLGRLGPREATGREICRQAGVSHGLLRHYFQTSEQLFLDAYKDLCDRYLAEFEQGITADDSDPWRPIESFFEKLFSDKWASAELLAAWTAFWTLTSRDEAFAQVNDAHNRRLCELLVAAMRRLPQPRSGAVCLEDAAQILSSLMDGLWLELCLRPDAAKRARAIEMCRLVLRRLFA